MGSNGREKEMVAAAFGGDQGGDTLFFGGERAPLAALNGRASTLEKGTSKALSESFCVCR